MGSVVANRLYRGDCKIGGEFGELQSFGLLDLIFSW